MRSHPRARRPAGAVSAAVLALASCGSDPSTLSPRGTGAREIAVLWWVMFALGTAVFALVVVLLVRVARHRRPHADEHRDDERSGHRWILWGGVVLPVVVVVPLSFLTLVIGERLADEPDGDAVEIEVIGNQFWWEVRYPGTDAVTANEIHIPVDREARITMTSADVVHSLWVPSLHGKVDLIPGEETEIVLDAVEAGTYEGLCAEFCGIQHTHMRLLVVAHPEDEFEEWLAREAGQARPPRTAEARAGGQVFDDVGCGSCHTVRGTDAVGQVGPDLTHIGSRLTLGANTIPNTRGHLGGWIANSQQIKPGNRMPPSVLEGPELIALLEYLEGLE
jgi:cytochrome c oxidase subunit 2